MPYKTKNYYLNSKNFRSKVFQNPKKLRLLIKLAKTRRYSAVKLAKIFKCNKKSIFYALYCNKVVLQNLGKFKKEVFCDVEFFKKLNPISAYWAGFIAADGVLSFRDSLVSITLNEKDIRHLQKFKKSIKTNAKIGYTKSNNSSHLSIYSKELFNSLLGLGITPNKSLTITKIKIPNSLTSYFIRGVFDGDGSISGRDASHVQFDIVGNKPFLEWIQDILIKKCRVNKVRIYPTASKAYRLQYTGLQIFKILEFLYKESAISTRLDRKYKKYLLLKKKFLIPKEKLKLRCPNLGAQALHKTIENYEKKKKT